MEVLKTERVRRQVEQLEREVAAERQTQEAETEAEAAPAAAAAPVAPPPVAQARIRLRHVLVVLSFVVMVALPVMVAAWYLWTWAHDRYVSYAGFSVRKEEIGSALELLGGVAELSGSSSSDTDILYKFIKSTELTAKVDAQLDLRKIWSAPGWSWYNPDDDPVFAYHPPGTIEDLTVYWNRMVHVYSDAGTGLIDIEVQAFTPEDARAINRMIYDESSAMINRLTAIAREDAIRYARDDLEQSAEQLKDAREIITRFRNENQIVDPQASIQGQMGLLTSLQAQLAEALIDLDILLQATAKTDPRVVQGERRVEVIRDRIDDERSKLGIGTTGGDGRGQGERVFADIVGEYERLAVDLHFAESSYTAARAAYDTALAEAQRQSRYLTAHVQPTLPEAAKHPERVKLLALVLLFSGLTWAIAVLIGYALRDRR